MRVTTAAAPPAVSMEPEVPLVPATRRFGIEPEARATTAQSDGQDPKPELCVFDQTPLESYLLSSGPDRIGGNGWVGLRLFQSDPRVCPKCGLLYDLGARRLIP